MKGIPIGAIVFLLVVVFHILGQIAKFAAKRKAEEQARQAAQARRMQSMGLGTQNPNLATTPGLPGAGSRPGDLGMGAAAPKPGQSRLDDLAARRQAQLEQLRQRREGRRATTIASPTTTARAPGHAPVTPPSQQVPAMRQGVTIQESMPSGFLRDADVQRQRELQQKQQAAETRAARGREAQERARKQAERRRQIEAARRTVEEQPSIPRAQPPAAQKEGAVARAVVDPYRLMGRTNLAVALRTQLNEPAGLRQLLVIKEILDQPVSMRESAI